MGPSRPVPFNELEDNVWSWAHEVQVATASDI